MSSGVKKTNAMRMLDGAKIPYEVRTYEFEDTDIRGINIVLVQCHCMKKGVFRTQFPSIQARSINGPHSRQGTIWPWLNIRLDIFKFCHYRVPMARRQSNHPQQKNSRESIHIISFLGIINKKTFGDFCKSKFSLCKS